MYTTGTHVQANHGGLRAETGAYIATGWWDYPNNGDKPGGGNRSGYYDAFSFEWSTVGAANVYWGEANYSDIYQFEEEATLNTWPYYATAPAALTEAPIDASSFQIAAARSADAPSAARPGEEPSADPLHATVVEAERLRSLGKIDEATELLHTGLMEATTERERGVLASTAVRLLGSPRTPRKRTVLHDWAESRAEGAGPERPWALRMLTAAHLYDEGGQEAERYARRLLAEPSRHRVFAHEILARVATERGDERAAMGHLGALAALNERAASETARGISAAFDGADPDVVLQRARAESVRHAQVEAIGADEADGALRVGVAPNPASEAVEITVTGEAALSSVQVYDTLGRRVLDADEAWSRLDVAQLPAGVYIVQVTAEDGRMATTRFTVTR